MKSTPVDSSPLPPTDLIVASLLEAIPTLSALYHLPPAPLRADTRTLTFAILYDGDRSPAMELWNASRHLAAALVREVELTDLIALPTHNQLKLVRAGQRLWARDRTAELYEHTLTRAEEVLRDQHARLLADIASTIEAVKRPASATASEPPPRPDA